MMVILCHQGRNCHQYMWSDKLTSPHFCISIQSVRHSWAAPPAVRTAAGPRSRPTPPVWQGCRGTQSHLKWSFIPGNHKLMENFLVWNYFPMQGSSCYFICVLRMLYGMGKKDMNKLREWNTHRLYLSTDLGAFRTGRELSSHLEQSTTLKINF